MTGSTPHVVVVGSLNADLIVDVASLPRPNETVHAHNYRTAVGGKGLNQAVAAARMGARVSMVGAVGDDAMGAMARAHLAKEGVDFAHVATVGAHTGVAQIVVAQDGSNMIAVALGANAEVSPEMVERAASVIASADILVVQFEIPLESVAAALAIARRAGVRTLLNPAPADRALLPLLPQVDLVTPNETEVETLTGIAVTDAETATAGFDALMEGGARGALVTLGARGSRAVLDGQGFEQPAFPVDAIDTTGAGDVFNGALACAWASGLPLAEAMRMAAAAAAISVTRPSADAAPTRAEVEAFLAERGHSGIRA